MTDRSAAARTRLLDAAETLLVSEGAAAISTRRLGAVSGVNHGLVHYYWGSVEELLLAVLERFTKELLDRQRLLFERPVPFVDRWREAMRHLIDDDSENGYQKVWFELQALAWNLPQLRQRVAAVNDAWRSVVTDAVTGAIAEGELDSRGWPVEAVVALIITANEGVMLERLSGVSAGHAELLAAVDAMLDRGGNGHEGIGAER